MSIAEKHVPSILEIRVFNHFEYNGVVVTVHGVKHEYKTDTIIVQKTGSYFYCYCTRWELKALPLTDAFLKKLGFGKEMFVRGNMHLEPVKNGYQVIASNELMKADIMLHTVTHVHALQNLYYDLFNDHVMFNMMVGVELGEG